MGERGSIGSYGTNPRWPYPVATRTVISGASGRTEDDEITARDLPGLAVQDIRIAKAIYVAAGRVTGHIDLAGDEVAVGAGAVPSGDTGSVTSQRPGEVKLAFQGQDMRIQQSQ